MWSDMSNHGWWWGFGPLPMLLFWVLLIVGIVALGKWVFDRPGAHHTASRRSTSSRSATHVARSARMSSSRRSAILRVESSRGT